MPGWEQDSWGYHGDDGHVFCCSGSKTKYGPKFGTKDTVGCGLNFRDNTAFFTLNGVYLKVACVEVNKEKLYPMVGLKKLGDRVQVNFGRTKFLFDIDNYMKVWCETPRDPYFPR